MLYTNLENRKIKIFLLPHLSLGISKNPIIIHIDWGEGGRLNTELKKYHPRGHSVRREKQHRVFSFTR